LITEKVADINDWLATTAAEVAMTKIGQ